MYSNHTINAIKKKMLSRRSFFKTAAATGVGAAAAAMTSPSVAMAQGHNQLVDLTHTLHESVPTYLGGKWFAMEEVANVPEHGSGMFKLAFAEHIGTHVDAGAHVAADGFTIDEIPVENLVAPLCVIDIVARAEGDPDTMVTPDDLKAWIAKYGPVPDNACVAMHSGWAAKWNNPEEYRGFDGKLHHFPGFHVETAKMLIEETKAMSIASDTFSLDQGIAPHSYLPTHHAWLPTGRFGIENIANLDKVPASGATIVVGAMKHKGGTGGPARIIAMV